MNRVKLYLGRAHAARVVRTLAESGGGQFSQIKAALAADEGPTPAPSVLIKTLRHLIDAKVVAKGDDGRYLLTTEPDQRISTIVSLACEMERERTS